MQFLAQSFCLVTNIFILHAPLSSQLPGLWRWESGGLSLKVCRSRDETGLVVLAHSHDFYLTILFLHHGTPEKSWKF